jgi:CRISP-associated protein Cas1
MRDIMVKKRLLERIVHDIRYLLLDETEFTENEGDGSVLLWDDIHGNIPNGINYENRLWGKQ